MKNYFVPVILAFIAIPGQSQENSIGSVSYQFLHQRDTLSTQYYEEQMGLVFGKQSAVYFSLNKELRDSIMKASFEQQLNQGSENMKFDLRTMPGVSPGAYYSFYQEKKAIILRPYMKIDYVYDQPLTKINWQIRDDVKDIGNFKCQKAIGDFGGRSYEAWFCPDIPVSAGPWKLYGLPGLILEAMDTSKQVKFIFKQFSITDFYKRDIVALPSQVEKTTKEEFEKMLQAIRDNPEKVLKGVLSEGVTFNAIKVTPAPRNLFNNPIELPKKKEH